MKLAIRLTNLIDDISGQFMVECGSEKPLPPKGLLIQFLNESYARLKSLLSRYMVTSDEREVSDGNLSNGCYGFELMISSRRAKGKATSIADVLHSYMVNASLAKIYSVSNLTELSNKRTLLQNNDVIALQELLHTKCPPEL